LDLAQAMRRRRRRRMRMMNEKGMKDTTHCC
jgi:hypothetical protein